MTNDNITSKFIWAGDNLLALQQGNNSFSYVADANKNVRQLVNNNTGAVVNNYEYSPFGKLINEVENVENPFKFSSEFADAETGLIYYNYRYYNPKLARWTKRDPIEESGGINIYGFVVNNSVSNSDKLGLKCCDSNPPSYQCCKKWEQAWEIAGNSSASQCATDIIGETWWGGGWTGPIAQGGLGAAGGGVVALGGGSATAVSLPGLIGVPLGATASFAAAYKTCTKYYCTSSMQAKCKCTEPGWIWDTWKCSCPNGTSMMSDIGETRTFTPEMNGETDYEWQGRN